MFLSFERLLQEGQAKEPPQEQLDGNFPEALVGMADLPLVASQTAGKSVVGDQLAREPLQMRP